MKRKPLQKFLQCEQRCSARFSRLSSKRLAFSCPFDMEEMHRCLTAQRQSLKVTLVLTPSLVLFESIPQPMVGEMTHNQTPI